MKITFLGWARIGRRIILALLLLAGAFHRDQAVEDKRFLFISLNAAGPSFKGDLDGRLILWHFDKAFFIPALAQESLLGLSFGQQWTAGAWEVAFAQASRVAPLSGGRTSAVRLGLLEVRGKTLLIKGSPVHPCFFLGFGIPWLQVEDGARLGGNVQAASYYGIAIVLGGGVQVNLGSRLFLNAGLSQRYLWLLYAFGGGKGRDVSRLINDQSGAEMRRPLKASGPSWEVGIGVKLL
ncbi:MAG TPA: hypothetical protein VGB72_01120 [Acidobacteriota bacterium]